MSLRILIGTTAIQRGRSGVGRYVTGLTAELARLPGIRLTLAGFDTDRPLFAALDPEPSWISVPEWLRSAPLDIAWHQTFLRGSLKSIDVLHIPTYRRLVFAPGLAQVATVHDAAAFELTGKYDWARVTYARRIAAPLARSTARVICVSRHASERVIHHFGLDAARVQVIPNGIDRSRFRPEGERYRTASGAPYFLYVARLEHPAKNHCGLIAAFEEFVARAPDLPHRLVLAGADWHGAEAVHAKLRASPARARIDQLGFVADQDLPSLYRGAAATVLPSRYEGFGLPVAEAMACGCRVIASSVGSLPEVCGDAATLLDPDDTPGWASALLAHAGEERSARQLEGLLANAGRFDWAENAKATAEVYRAAVEGRIR